MATDKDNHEAADTVLDAERIERLTLQLRAVCLAALKRGLPLDVEALLRAILRENARPTPEDEASTITRKPELARNDMAPTPDAHPATVEKSQDPAGPEPTLDYAPAPADANATLDFYSQQKTSPTLAGSSRGPSSSGAESFAGYEVVGVLGKGGMGVVYKARQRGLKRIVALKMIRRDDANESDLARFRIEAEAVAQLRHPNIVQVYEVGEDAGRPFMSMEYVDGGSLKEKLRGQPQPVQHAAQLVQLLAWGMSAAHRQGIIHRDLKPGNVMLMSRREDRTELRHDTTVLVEELYGTPKITDFGLAKRLEEDDGQTRSGSILGTPRYMAPEQARGHVKEVGPLADQYALGAMLYEMLTGRPPLEGATVLETLEQVCTREPVPPSRLQPKVPRDLETICLKSLQKDPAKRYRDCAALADDLRRFVAGEAILARPVSGPELLWRWCRRNPKVAALSGSILLLLCAILAGLSYFNLKLTEEQAQTKREKDAAVRARDVAERKTKEALAQRGVALGTLGDLVTNVQVEIGRLHGRQDLQKKLLAVAIESLNRVSENPAAKISLKDSTLAAAHDGLGRMYDGLGETEQAEKEYRLAEAAYAEQARLDPENPTCRANHAIMLMRLGHITLRRNGSSPEVQGYFIKAAELLSTVDHGQPGDRLSARDAKALRAEALRWLGFLVINTDLRQARDYYQTSLALREEVADLVRVEALRNGGIACMGLLATPLGQGSLLGGAAMTAAGSRIDDAHRDLAAWYIRVGGVEFRLRNPVSTQELYFKALGLSQEMAAAHPDNVGALWTLATAHERLGDFHLRTGRPEVAAAQHDAALRIYQDLVNRDPKRVSFQDDVSRVFYSIGLDAQRRGETSLAADKFHASLAIREARARGRTDLDTLRNLMVTLARCREYRRAAEMAERVRSEKSKDLGTLTDVACCFAICSDVVAAGKSAAGLTPEQSRLNEEYARQALAALRAAVDLGYRDVVNLETEPDLDALRARGDFKALLEALNRSPAK